MTRDDFYSHTCYVVSVVNQRQPTHDERVGLNLKAARERAGISQTALAERMAEAGFTAWRQTTVSRTERGERALKMGEFRKLGKIVGADLSEGTEFASSLRAFNKTAHAQAM